MTEVRANIDLVSFGWPATSSWLEADVADMVGKERMDISSGHAENKRVSWIRIQSKYLEKYDTSLVNLVLEVRHDVKDQNLGANTEHTR